MKKYLAGHRQGVCERLVRARPDRWRRRGAPSAAQQQAQPVLRERRGVGVGDERCSDPRKANDELEVAQRGVLLVVQAIVGFVKHHLRPVRRAVQAPPPP